MSCWSPRALGQELIVELTPIEVRGRVDRIDDDAGEPRGGAARSRAAAAAAAASFQVAMDLRYGQALACTRCLQPVRSEVTTHADLMVTTRPKRDPRQGRRSDGVRRPDRARPASGRAKKAKAHAKEPAAEPEVELEKDELGRSSSRASTSRPSL